MCLGQPATLEEIDAACKETPFHTPFWKGKSSATDIPERVLSPAEVDVINSTYLELKAAFDAKRQGQDAGVAIGQAEQNLAAQASDHHGVNQQCFAELSAQNKQILQNQERILKNQERLECRVQTIQPKRHQLHGLEGRYFVFPVPGGERAPWYVVKDADEVKDVAFG